MAQVLNDNGLCHGGMIFTLADTAFSYACNSHNQISVAMNCSITFLKPARNGDLLNATAQEQLLEGRNGIYDIEITNQDGICLTLFRGHSRTVSGTDLPVEGEA